MLGDGLRIAAADAFDHRQLFSFGQAGGGQQRQPRNQLRIPRRKFHRHFAPHAVSHQVVRRTLHELIYVNAQLFHEVIDING